MVCIKKPDVEPLPGYRLLSPLGKGGFGEVWKCEAPGGLFKAIKFVRGNGGSLIDGPCRSSEEMRAVQRIKDIRHPFLLSMERVERCGEELVIVMELADRSLHDVLVEKNGGLPRDEVLGWLREAAEVLDLMNFEYGLQHLDVKPRNLFLVRGHVKVADFGLVQNLDGGTRGGSVKPEVLHLSMVTPLYSAPELFQGKLSERCDQYSLAICFQELLTNTRPFDGKNIRQLMVQHTMGVPNLNPLPEHDRPAIARALSKEPDKRFASCTELVRALTQAGTGVRLTPPGVRLTRSRTPTGMRPSPGQETRTNIGVGMTQSLGPAEARALPDHQFCSCLGRDPRGETWEAKDGAGRPKIVHVLYGVGGAAGKFDPEALIHLQALRHPALLPMQIVSAGAGCLLIVTDLVETSLRQKYQEAVSRGEPGLPRAELLDRLEQAAAALDHLYQEQGLQHLELNPARLLLSGEKLLLDQMGTAQLVWVPSGVPCGQAQMRYTAPERGQGLVTRSCDQYSLAVIYQELLTGRHPFRGSSQSRVLTTRDTLKSVRTLDLHPLPAAERPVVARALETDPEKRFRCCMDFIRALRAAGASASAQMSINVDSDPARAIRREQVARLVEEAKQWLQQEQDSMQDICIEEPDSLQRRFMAMLPPGAAIKKFEAFRKQWDAVLLEENEASAGVQVDEKARSWLRWRTAPALRVEVRWSKPTALSRKMPDVVARVSPTSDASLPLLPQLGPLLIESLQASLLGSPERRNGERVVWPNPVEATSTGSGRSRGETLECQAKDISLTGMGLYMPAALPTSQVQLRLTSPATGEVLLLPASIVRIQRWDDQLYEVGVVFE